MVHRELDLDDPAMAQDRIAEQSEETHRSALLDQKERAERGFHADRFTAWEEVKKRNGL